MEDGRIVDLYLARDEAAIAASAAKYGARLRAVGDNILGDRQAAEECENDTYLAAWRSIPPHEPRGYLWAYLARLLRHAALDRIRAGRAQKRASDLLALGDELAACLPSPEDVEGTVERRALSEAISAFLRGLPTIDRALFVRRYFHAESLSALAARFGMREGTAKSRLYRLRERLREHLEKEGFAV